MEFNMRILNVVLATILTFVGIFFVGGILISPEWSVSRTMMINADADKIYPYISQFKEWEKWAPWNASKDKTLKYTYSGPDEGVGAKQSWTSEKMGTGWMEFTSANPSKGVSYTLFIDMNGMQSTLHGQIKLSAKGDKTRVKWTDHGDSGASYTKRWMSLMVKYMLGKDFDTGLIHLKQLVEK